MSTVAARGHRLGAVVAFLAIIAMGLPVSPGNASIGTVTAGGPYGGEVLGLSVNPRDSQQILAATSQGIFRSTNAGARWTAASAGLRSLAVHETSWDVDTAGTVYAATNGGLFRSTDSGASWSEVISARQPLTFDPDYHLHARYVQSVPGAVYAASKEHLIVSRDGGASWSVVYRADGGSISGFGVAPSDSNVVYLARENADGQRVIRSEDGGANWLPTGLAGALGIDVDAHDPDVAYAHYWSQVAVTTDGGASWAMSSLDDPALAGLDEVVLSVDGTLWVVGSRYYGKVVARSEDGGATWHATRMGGPGGTALAVDPANDAHVYLGGYGDGVHRSTDGAATFTRSNNGLTAQPAYAVATDPTNAARLYSSLGKGGMFASADGGTSWADVTSGLSAHSEPYSTVDVTGVAVDARGDVYVARDPYRSPGSPVLASADAGTTWTPRDAGLPLNMQTGHIVAHPTQPGVLLVSFWKNHWETGLRVGRTFRTNDGGHTWDEVHAIEGAVSAVHVDTGSGRMLLATSGDNLADAGDALYESTDFGRTWKRLAFPERMHSVVSLGLDQRTGRIYAGGTVARIAISDDNGETWNVSDLNLANHPAVSVIAVDPLDNMQIIAGTLERGLWFSRDRGATWDTATPGVRGQRVYALAFSSPATTTFTAAASTGTTSTTTPASRPAYVGMSNGNKSGLSRITPRPHNRTKTAILGTPQVGRRLTCSRGWWTRATSYSYRWYRNGDFITGETSQLYDVVRGDRGDRLRCRVAARGPGGRSVRWSRSILVN